MKTKEWLVKQPGEHGSGLRVVQRIGLTVEGKEIFAGVCEILTSRSSLHNYDDSVEQARARMICALPKLLAAAKQALPYLADHVAMTTSESPSDRIAYDSLEAAIKDAETP